MTNELNVEWPRGTFKDSHAVGLEWESRNASRAIQLCDAIDACASVRDKRVLYSTFTDTEKCGVLPELDRRRINRMAPVGSIVGPVDKRHGFGIRWNDGPRCSSSAMHCGTATVIGQPAHGSHKRMLMLHDAWTCREGGHVVFVTAMAHELEVI